MRRGRCAVTWPGPPTTLKGRPPHFVWSACPDRGAPSVSFAYPATPGSTGRNQRGKAMADFMFIFRGGESPGSPEQQQKHMQQWMSWFDQLAKAGVYKGAGAPLLPGGKSVRGPKKLVSDGPYGEAKDLVGGYAIIEAKDLDAAVELARGCPTYEVNGAVEVRPVQKLM
jgi:hypothetical protein